MPAPEKIPFKGRIIDITVPISHSTPIFPGDPEPSIESACTLEKDGCVVSRLSFGSHIGTHVDAPSHIFKDGLTVDNLNLENLMGWVAVLDFSQINGALTDSILDKAFNYPKLSKNISILLLKTKNSFENGKSFKSPDIQTKGSEKRGESDKRSETDKSTENSVFLNSSAAEWIVRKGFKTVGINNFSVDSLSSEDLPAHHMLLSNNVNIVECLDLSSVEEGVYFFLCLPLKIEGCDGAPARALLISDS